MPIREFFIYLLILSGSTYLIRAIPFTMIRGKIKNPFIKSFLYYIPYTVLTTMTFPAALYATGSVITAAIGLICAVLVSIKTKNLTVVAISATLGVLVGEIIMSVV